VAISQAPKISVHPMGAVLGMESDRSGGFMDR